MLRDKRFRLLTLGRLTLEGEAGEDDGALARRRSKLAVLAVLAMTRRPMTRDTLIGMFWGEQDE
jgi:DNA-binding SARP family transcriptional activator